MDCEKTALKKNRRTHILEKFWYNDQVWRVPGSSPCWIHVILRGTTSATRKRFIDTERDEEGRLQ